MTVGVESDAIAIISLSTTVKVTVQVGGIIAFACDGDCRDCMTDSDEAIDFDRDSFPI